MAYADRVPREARRALDRLLHGGLPQIVASTGRTAMWRQGWVPFALSPPDSIAEVWSSCSTCSECIEYQTGHSAPRGRLRHTASAGRPRRFARCA
jgi:hypothetical protein